MYRELPNMCSVSQTKKETGVRPLSPLGYVLGYVKFLRLRGDVVENAAISVKMYSITDNEVKITEKM
jgi:hypothetical protein